MDPEQIPLRDLHLPDAISWWPLAPGWWGLFAIIAIVFFFWLHFYLRRRAKGAPRRFALRELDRLADDYRQDRNAVRFGARASELLRRTMLAYAPRTDVASLTGDAWLEWLDRDLARPVFVNGPGRQLLELPYRDPAAAVELDDLEQLVAAIRHRVATPVGSAR
ncbi:MAG: DUF4381 domain-containing protein [Pseudomonadota bacterium]